MQPVFTVLEHTVIAATLVGDSTTLRIGVDAGSIFTIESVVASSAGTSASVITAGFSIAGRCAIFANPGFRAGLAFPALPAASAASVGATEFTEAIWNAFFSAVDGICAAWVRSLKTTVVVATLSIPAAGVVRPAIGFLQSVVAVFEHTVVAAAFVSHVTALSRGTFTTAVGARLTHGALAAHPAASIVAADLAVALWDTGGFAHAALAAGQSYSAFAAEASAAIASAVLIRTVRNTGGLALPIGTARCATNAGPAASAASVITADFTDAIRGAYSAVRAGRVRERNVAPYKHIACAGWRGVRIAACNREGAQTREKKSRKKTNIHRDLD